MPRLSDYLQREVAAAATVSQQAVGAAAAPAAAVLPGPAAATAVSEKESALDAELARLQRAYNNRLRDHGSRMYRQPDGSLASQPPPADPYTVANRRRWSGLVRHCRQQPGVDVQLEKTGIAVRYNVGVTYEQYANALEAIGLTPEFDAEGTWHGYDARHQDQLAGDAATSHPLADEEWKDITRSILQRAVQIHGDDTIQRNGWQNLLEAVQQLPATS